VRPEGGAQVPPIAPPPAAEVTVTGRLRDSETAPQGKEPFDENGFRQVYAIDTRQLSTLIGVPLTSSYVQLIEGQPGGLGVIPLPHLDAGPFLSYGIQWIVFGIVAPIGLGYFIYTEAKARRRERGDTPVRAAPLTVEEKLADRYGRRR